MAVVEDCTYTLPIDSLCYLQDFADTYDRRIGVSGVERNHNYKTLDLLRFNHPY